jgi:hypothetical protein
LKNPLEWLLHKQFDLNNWISSYYRLFQMIYLFITLGLGYVCRFVLQCYATWSTWIGLASVHEHLSIMGGACVYASWFPIISTLCTTQWHF